MLCYGWLLRQLPWFSMYTLKVRLHFVAVLHNGYLSQNEYYTKSGCKTDLMNTKSCHLQFTTWKFLEKNNISCIYLIYKTLKVKE